MKKIFFFIISFTISFTVYTQTTKIFKTADFSFKYPSSWVIRDFPQYDVLISEPAGEELTFMSTFDIEQDLKAKSVNDYCSDYEERLNNNETFKRFEIKSKNKINYLGLEATEYHCTAYANYLPIEWKSIIFLYENCIYKLSFTSMIGKFTILKKEQDSIYNSFDFEKN